MSKFVFYVTCLYLCKMARVSPLSTSLRQDRHFISTHVGENITLQCFCDRNAVPWLYWYKQALGQKPRCIFSLYKYSNKTFYGEYKDNSRFALEISNSEYHLNISDLRSSDSATYYCASKRSLSFEFGEGVTVIVFGGDSNIHESGPETIRPGGSVHSCTVHTGTCDRGLSVYLFKHSGLPHPGFIYTHGGRNDSCERKPETQTHTCIYNLPIENINLSHAGTYYCAFASCGHILFGKGTKLETEDQDSVVYFLRAVVMFSTFLSVSLAFSVCVISMTRSHLYTDSSARVSHPSRYSTEVYQHGELVNHSDLMENKITRRRRLKDDTWSECVYFSVKQQI